MKELHIDRFDALLSLASAECVKEEAADFLSADISDIEDNPQMLRKVLGGSRRGKWKTVKIILLVALLCMAIAFTACMLVPEIRNAIWNVIVRERESSVEIEFDTGAEADPVNASIVGGYPKTIEKKMELTYVPEGCIVYDEVLTSIQHSICYSNSEGEWKFTISQSVIGRMGSFINENAGKITCIEIAGYSAVLMESNEGSFSHKLIWQDDQYRYSICGSFLSSNEIIRIAEGIT